MNERLPGAVPPSLKYIETYGAVLSIESYAEITKRNGNDGELDSLKIMSLNGI